MQAKGEAEGVGGAAAHNAFGAFAAPEFLLLQTQGINASGHAAMGRTVHPPPPSLVQAPLQPAKGGAEVQASTLWQDKPVRASPGLPLMAADARVLTS